MCKQMNIRFLCFRENWNTILKIFSYMLMMTLVGAYSSKYFWKWSNKEEDNIINILRKIYLHILACDDIK
jgi:Kef-type K+ transport system membrane component KefB